MALKVAYDVRCSCGAAFTGDIYEYVFAEHDPELKDAILSGEFNLVPCPSCGQRLLLENRFLYRDEKNRLWVWVCGKEEKPLEEALTEELIEKSSLLDCHFLDEKDDYRKFLVFGRSGLLELLLKEDPDLQKSEKKVLKRNPAFHCLRAGYEEPGVIIFTGRKIRASMPLRFPESRGTHVTGREEKARWLKHYAQGLNVHNPYSSFLDKRLISKWDRIREKEPMDGVDDGFADFAESWACLKIDAKGFSARYPERRAFFDGLGKRSVSRKLRSLDPGKVSRESGGRR
jgi:CpXC protein